MRSAARRQAMPSSDSRISYSSHSSCWLSDTTRAPACGTRTSSLWPSRRCSASRSGPRLTPWMRASSGSEILLRGHLALDDGGLDLLEDLVRQRFAIAWRGVREREDLAHGVDNLARIGERNAELAGLSRIIVNNLPARRERRKRGRGCAAAGQGRAFVSTICRRAAMPGPDEIGERRKPGQAPRMAMVPQGGRPGEPSCQRPVSG